MRHRGAPFWAWAAPTPQHDSHEEELADGAWLDVQVRRSGAGDTQLFIGIYERSGLAGTDLCLHQAARRDQYAGYGLGAYRGRGLAEMQEDKAAESALVTN